MRTIPDYLLRNADSLRGGDFLRLLDASGGSASYSYREVIEASSGWARAYSAEGLHGGDRVVIILKHSFELYASFLGALLGGFVPAIFAFPSPKFSEEEYFKTIGSLMENAKPSLIVVYPELKERLASRLARGGGSTIFRTPAELRTDPAPLLVGSTVEPGSTAFLQYSSGTTGVKKGVAVSHSALIWQVEEYARAIGAGASDLIVSWLPLYHDMGLIACLFLPFLKGIPLVAMSPFDWVQRPVLLAKAITEFKGTLVWMPNFAFQFMARNIADSDLESVDFGSLRGVINCSEPITDRSLQEFRNRFAPAGLRGDALSSCYAMAENTFAVSSGGFDAELARDRIDSRIFTSSGKAVPAAPGDPDPKVLVSSGKLLPGVAVEILSEAGRVLDEREVGEIAIRSPCLLTEYFDNPEATRKVLHEGRYLTGDLGYLAGGELFVTGRKKDLIIIGGQNIYPQDLEAIINEVPGVIPGRNVALGVPNPAIGTEMLVLLVETDATDPTELERIRTGVFDRIASRTDVVPKEIRLLPHSWLLKSSSGKISRVGNLEKYLAQLEGESGLKGEAQLPRRSTGGMHDLVRDCVAKALLNSPAPEGRSLRDDTPLISSGLVDSLSLAELLSNLEKSSGISIPRTVPMGSPGFDDIEGITGVLESLADKGAGSGDIDRGAGLPSPIPMRIGGRRAPSRPPAGFWTWFYRLLFRAKGIRFGKGLRVLGPIMLRLDGNAANIRLGDDVTLMPFVDLKIRENGKIILGNGVVLDTLVRMVAANNAKLELGDQAQIGMGTIVNAGADVLIGRRTAIAGYCIVIASEHRFGRGEPVMAQGYNHSPVHIGEDVWVASQAFVGRGSRIGDGAVISVKSTVTGSVPPYAVWAGSPGRVIKYRS